MQWYAWVKKVVYLDPILFSRSENVSRKKGCHLLEGTGFVGLLLRVVACSQSEKCFPIALVLTFVAIPRNWRVLKPEKSKRNN